jgi:hypothetical protein
MPGDAVNNIKPHHLLTSMFFEIIGFHAQEMNEKKELVFETEVESKNKCARDEGEERASFQNKDREKILCKRRRGRQRLFSETEV